MATRGLLQRMLPVVIIAELILAASTAAGHDHPTKAEIDRSKADGSYQRRLQWIKALHPYRMDPNLQRRAIFNLKYQAMKAQGLSNAEISRRLFGGMAMAFPFAANPELRSYGTVKTLTVLVDFQDHRAATELPGITPATVAPNIYGPGTTAGRTFFPYESVNAYYSRASQGKVDIQGDVQGWYTFPHERAYYDPNSTDDNVKNGALFKIVTEALDSLGPNYNFAQYDNDNDGDIDLVTVLYCGPNTGWGSFWWAYRWEFFVPEASTKTYQGKRLKQFVFEFIDTRANGSDFDPRTLIHETGHSFGLADYYSYPQADGGVGGLDMMDANRGNHNAFSRWLLDWIQPEVIGSGAPALKHLTASASPLATNKAIAIFPTLSNTAAPGQELFIVENRFPTGNDAAGSEAPGGGLLIWHVDARPNANHNNFLQDNSFTSTKLIRLMRADNAQDFAKSETATASTYFISPKEFTPTSVPNSQGNDGTWTGVSVSNISPVSETMSATIGLLPGPTSTEAPPSPPGPSLARASGEIRAMLSQAPTANETVVDIDRLQHLTRDVENATPQALRVLWESTSGLYSGHSASREAQAVVHLVLAQWATKDGKSAADAVLHLPEGQLRQKLYPLVMEAWADSNPYAAAKWYFDPLRADLRASDRLRAGQEFASRLFRWSAMSNLDAAVTSLDDLHHAGEVWGAFNAIEDVAEARGLSEEVLSQKFNNLKRHQDTLPALKQFREGIHQLDAHIKDSKVRSEIRAIMESALAPESATPKPAD